MAETFGERLVRLRTEAGLTQKALCEAANVPIQTLRNWERGRREPLLSTAARLARAIGVTLDELMPGNGGDEGPKKLGRKKGK
jgi:transcriptional regulator with XRE-family HTH domain